MSVLTHNQEIYAATLSKITGLNRNVVRGWLLAEESFTAARGRDSSGNQNWLNYSAGTGPGGRFDHPEWNNNPVKAATDTASHILHSDYYKGIVATVGKHPADQIQAIADSPWSADHYGGGSHLVSTYHLVSGLPAPHLTTTPDTTTDTSTTTPDAPKTIVDDAQTPDDPIPVPQADLVPLPPLHMKGSTIALPPLPSLDMPTIMDSTQAPTPAGVTVKPDKPDPSTVVLKPGGGWAGTQNLATTLYTKYGKANGLSIMSEKRDRKNTASGGISDHWVGSKNAFAIDMSNGSHETPEMAKTAMQIATALGAQNQWIAQGRKGVLNVTINGYRYQMLYSTDVGGNHHNHVHLGVRKV